MENTIPLPLPDHLPRYTCRRWPALTRYVQDIRRPMGNNRAENVIRPVAVGQKNWLFASSPVASQRTASIMSLLATARLNGIDPHQWLHSMLRHLQEWPNARLRELLPYPENRFD